LKLLKSGRKFFADLRKNGQGIQYLADELLIPADEMAKLVFGLVTVGLSSSGSSTGSKQRPGIWT
jgi:hypothetical protein